MHDTTVSCITNSQNPLSIVSLCILLLCLFFSSVVHGTYLQVSAGVADWLPLRHFTAASVPRIARSFPGFVQSTTVLLHPSCHPASSAHPRSISTSMWEGGLWRVWGSKRERRGEKEQHRVDSRGDQGGGVLLNTGIEQRAASLWCSRWAWMSCLLGLELQKCALLFLYNDTLKAGKWHHNKERDECGGCAGGWWGLGGLMVKKKKKKGWYNQLL